MISIKRFSELSYKEAVVLWNEGFKYYFSNMTMTVDAFIRKLANEGLSPEHSVVAYVDHVAVGFAINGFREMDGKKIAWNGGTGIKPEFRGQGIGKVLIEACLDVYREQGVDLALLEAVAQNERAIALYKKMGYEVFEELVFLQQNGAMTIDAFHTNSNFEIVRGIPEDIQSLEFFQPIKAWQVQVPSCKGAESIIVKKGNEVLAYAVYQRMMDEKHNIQTIALNQCEIKESIDDQKVADFILYHVFQPHHKIKRMVRNLSKNNRLVYNTLLAAGFETLVEQVHMSNRLDQPIKESIQ